MTAAPRIPLYPLGLDGLTDQVDDPTSGVQYRVVDEDGKPHLYGDQPWVADGRALYHHPDGHVEYRTVTITYGEWTVPVEPTVRDVYGTYALEVYDLEPGNQNCRIVLRNDGIQIKEFPYPAYKVWTLLAHWTENDEVNR